MESSMSISMTHTKDGISEPITTASSTIMVVKPQQSTASVTGDLKKIPKTLKLHWKLQKNDLSDAKNDLLNH